MESGMSAPMELLDLIARFDENLEEYTSSSFTENTAKSQFIEPFFELLGWDVVNRAGKPEARRDVLRGHSIPCGPSREAPDYIFKIGNIKAFVVEAMKPSVSIKQDANAAFQLRSYGWNSKLPIAILTNFLEFAVYDCRRRPQLNDGPEVGRLRYFVPQDFVEKWDEFFSMILARQSVEHGRLDSFIETIKAAKGAIAVDEALLREIEIWRRELAQNIATRNPNLTQQELNYAVQMTIDRIVFLRIAEDRGIESPNRLLALTKGKRIYPRLFKLFEAAHDRYNSGLFHFREEKGQSSAPDRVTPGLDIDDDKLQSIIGGLDHNIYDFSLIPVEILGQIYEKFLGNVTALTPAHHARIKEKPEVKKAGGVFYTPDYVVDYIIGATLGKMLEGLTPAQAAKLKILDPACGSGSFLVGAYRKLMEWHLDYYAGHDPEKQRQHIFPVLGGGFRLTTWEKKRILTNNIYGLDIDPQAVEVTKLTLLLSVLEGETEESLQQFKLVYQERALPDLSNNIKAGNALIGFSWESGFPRVFDGPNRGFDLVIGNPPYGIDMSARELQDLRERYQDDSLSFDSYELFLLKASQLLGRNGVLSMIIPASWLTGEKYRLSRKGLLDRLAPTVAYAMPFDVFKDAYIDAAIVVLEKPPRADQCLMHFFPKKAKLSSIPVGIGECVSIKKIKQGPNCRFSIYLADKTASIAEKLNGSAATLGDWFAIQRGVQPYSRAKHSEEKIKQRFLHAANKAGQDYLPELQGNELSRYHIKAKRASYLRYCDELASIRDLKMFQRPRIVLRRLITRKFRLQASMTSETMITTDNVLNLTPKGPESEIPFALGLLNSQLISWFYVNNSMVAQKDDFPQVHISALAQIPLPNYSHSQKKKMETMVTRMVKLSQTIEDKCPDHKRTMAQRQIEALDRRIDELVYELYGLGADEIKIVSDG
jgi:hypothetical protein